ncbi:MAG TPA: replication initiator protein A [Gemmatimonadaceae bacterium]|nr:replication initiator protein A [Gemmatimonadaceae bacterium]
MILAPRRRTGARLVTLDRALERLPLFRLSDSTSAEDVAISYTTEAGGRWRVLPSPGDRLPGTFDQDVYVELLHRYHEAGAPEDGVVTFTLHSFLRSIGRRADGRTYEQLRGALGRLERTTLDSQDAYAGPDGRPLTRSFTILSSVVIDRRRLVDREQLALFPQLLGSDPGDARATLSPTVRANVDAGRTSALTLATYHALASPVARRLYRLLAAVLDDTGDGAWRVPLDRLAGQLPLAQRYPSHLQRVLQPAHDMLVAAGVVRTAAVRQDGREWLVEYERR